MELIIMCGFIALYIALYLSDTTQKDICKQLTRIGDLLEENLIMERSQNDL